MRRDQCRFCFSARCYSRVVSLDRRVDWDEVACRKHARELEALADEEIPGVYRTHISSTDPLARGPVDVDWACLVAYRKSAMDRGIPLRPLVLHWADSQIPPELLAAILAAPEAQ